MADNHPHEDTTSMYTIYTSPGSGGFAAEAMLEAGTSPWRRQTISTANQQHRTAEYLQVNPAGQVPALQLPGGEVMTESAAICIYLGDAHPETGLAPSTANPARAPYLRWLLYMSSTVYPADLRIYYADRYTSDPAGVDAVKTCALEEMNASFALIDKALSGRRWLAGGTMTAADIYLLMMACWHPEEGHIASHCHNVHALCNRVKQDEYVKRANDFHKLW
jgi:glutathione S-transferase